MRLGLFVLLSLAGCAAQTSRSDSYFPPPYFDDGENLSSQNCGNNETTRKQSTVYVQNIRTQLRCIDLIAISQRTILTEDYCDFKKSDSTDLLVFPNSCLFHETEERCNRLSTKVLDVIKIAISPAALYNLMILITEKMPSEVVAPICLFNRDNVMDSQLQRDSTFIQWSIYQWSPDIMTANVTRQSNCSTVLSSTELGRLELYDIPIQNIICAEKTEENYKFLINFYKGRYFWRGLKLYWGDRFYIDILAYIDEIARHAKDISALRPIPETKQPKGFNAPDNLTSFPNCGIKPTSRRRKRGNNEELPPTSLIFGGHRAQTGDHPWHVYFENEVTGGACGGTLISPTVVLTAAHCIYGSKAEDFRVSLGMYDKRQRRAPGVQTTSPSRLIVHPKYDSTIFTSDVGLMILQPKIKITDNVLPICLWNVDSDPNLERVAGTEAMAVGFGLVDNYTLPDKLQEVRLPILAHKECYLSKRGFFGKYLRPGDNFCAGYKNGTTACNGDSGGSLSVEKDGRWFIRGIVSFGLSKKVLFEDEERSFCHPDQYSLFADVASYVDWIVENTPDISFRN